MLGVFGGNSGWQHSGLPQLAVEGGEWACLSAFIGNGAFILTRFTPRSANVCVVCMWVSVGVHACVFAFAFANFYIEIYHTRNLKPTGESIKNKTVAKSYANQVEVSMRFEIKLNNHFNKLKRMLSD